ncbi:MAG: NnrS family protein [Gammaproteobacteria bacterium]
MTLREHWSVFTAAPHRVMMFAGALQLVVTLLFWGAELAGRYTRLWSPLPTVEPAVWVHAFLMIYGLFPFFILGFLMTTYPRWMNGEPIARPRYVTPFLTMAAAVAVYYAGVFLGRQWMALGVIILLVGWLSALSALYRVFRTAPARDKSTERFLNVALAMGGVGMSLYLLWLLTGDRILVRAAIGVGLWWFLVPVLVTVAHRMIPFFSNSVLRDYRVVQPRWTVPAVLACTTGHLALELAGRYQWLFLFDLPLAAIALYHTVRWQWRRSFQVRLLAMLHVGFSWLTVAMTLYSIQSLVLLATGDRFVLGLAPLHALGIGFVAGMSVAMVSRVTLGHSGRPLAAGALTWVCFWGVSLAAALRVAGDAPVIYAPFGVPLNLVAAAAWLLFLTPWAIHYGRMLARPRVDGRPG